MKGGAEKVLNRTSKDISMPSCTVMNNQVCQPPPFADLGTMQIQATLILSFAQSVESTKINYQFPQHLQSEERLTLENPG